MMNFKEELLKTRLLIDKIRKAIKKHNQEAKEFYKYFDEYGIG